MLSLNVTFSQLKGQNLDYQLCRSDSQVHEFASPSSELRFVGNLIHRSPIANKKDTGLHREEHMIEAIMDKSEFLNKLIFHHEVSHRHYT